jgi:putative ABC transport system permease protein
MSASENFFNFFPFKRVAGSYKDALKGRALLPFLLRLPEIFGKTDVVGESIKFDDKNYSVTAVYELPKENSQIKPEFLFNPVQRLRE